MVNELEKLKSRVYDLAVIKGRINQEILTLDNKIKELSGVKPFNNKKGIKDKILEKFKKGKR
jgi:hypothetical protein